ncbi:hypothetical protein U1872_00410 [Sphingomonas sp. RB3P16]|uniref:hypothetical protein n=1 Tax=Parasphingomonas frigoris TaxID=3096163 RepID=UPI002FC84943
MLPSVPPPPPVHTGRSAALLLPLCVIGDGMLFAPAACLVAILAARDRQPVAMLVWYGLAVGFDAQALLLAPFIGAILIGGRAPWRLLPIAPVLALAMLLARGPDSTPALPLPQDIAVSHGAPNLWAILGAMPWIGDLPLTGLALTLTLGAGACYLASFSARPLARGAVLDAALLCALILPGVAPARDGHAFLLAAGIATVRALDEPGVARWWRAALIGAGTAIASIGGATAAALGGVMLLVATILQARAMLCPAANDNVATVRLA